MNQIFKTPYLLLLALLFSCSSDDDITPEVDPDPDPVRPIIEIDLYADEAVYNIFDHAQFGLKNKNGDKIFFGLDLLQYYDSIVWEIPEVDRVKLTDKSDDYPTRFYGSITTSWSHHFFTPQTVESRLLCYQDGEIVYQSKTSVAIGNRKDFLNFNWADIKEPTFGLEGYIDFFKYKRKEKRDVKFRTSLDYKNDIPSASLFYMTNEEEGEIAETAKDNLYTLITSLYDLPTYDDENKELLNEKYTELFDASEELEPCYIWLTQTSRIVLAKRNDTYLPYKVYAEPK